MGLMEKLKALFNAGQLTEDELTEAESKLEGEAVDASENSAGQDGTKDSRKEELPESVRSLIQSSIDRATNKLGNENKQLREELEKLRRQHMTEDEVKKLDYEERMKELQEKESEIKAQQLKMHAIAAMKKSGLDDGSEDALKLLNFLTGESEEAIDQRATELKALLDSRVKTQVDQQVDQRFKGSGREMKGSGQSTEAKKGAPGVDFAERLGKEAAQSNQAAQKVLDLYTDQK